MIKLLYLECKIGTDFQKNEIRVLNIEIKTFQDMHTIKHLNNAYSIIQFCNYK